MKSYKFTNDNLGEERIIQARNLTVAHLNFASGTVKDFYNWKCEGEVVE